LLSGVLDTLDSRKFQYVFVATFFALIEARIISTPSEEISLIFADSCLEETLIDFCHLLARRL
jgi:hypothetical protein